MLKFADLFYIFTKLITIVVLIVLLGITGYALFQSYKGVDVVSDNFDKKFLQMTSNINLHSSDLNELKNTVIENKKKLSSFINKISNLNNNEEEQLEKSILKLIKEIDEIKKQIDLMSLNKNNSNKKNNYEQKNSLKNLILLKFNNGQVTNNEIQLLESIISNPSSQKFEKLYLLDSKNFIGIEKLKDKFNLQLESYVKDSFLNDNQSLVIKFLSKYIDIRPGNLNVYEDKDLNILLRAKNHFESGEFLDSLNQIIILENNQFFFKDWLIQINLLLDFQKTLEKVG